MAILSIGLTSRFLRDFQLSGSSDVTDRENGCVKRLRGFRVTFMICGRSPLGASSAPAGSDRAT